MNRLNSNVQNMANGQKNSISLREQRDDDIVVVSAYRTPICRARKGPFNATSATALLVPVLKKMLETGLDPAAVSEICVGSVLSRGVHRHVESRMAGFLAGFPETTNVQLVNRQCSSGLQAMATVAAAIRAGYYEVGIAAGVESMSLDGKFAWNSPIMDDVPVF